MQNKNIKHNDHIILILGLPWRHIEEKENVLLKKEECIVAKKYWPPDFKIGNHFLQIIDYISQLEYQNSVDYEFLYNLLIEVS